MQNLPAVVINAEEAAHCVDLVSSSAVVVFAECCLFVMQYTEKDSDAQVLKDTRNKIREFIGKLLP